MFTHRSVPEALADGFCSLGLTEAWPALQFVASSVTSESVHLRLLSTCSWTFFCEVLFWTLLLKDVTPTGRRQQLWP